MKDKFKLIGKNKPSYTVLAKEIPHVGKPFKYTIISKESKRVEKRSKIVLHVTSFGMDTYQVETEDSIYYTAIEYSS